MDSSSRKLDINEGKLRIQTEEVEIKEIDSESYERNISNDDEFKAGNFSPEWQSLQVKDEELDVSVKYEPLDFNDYERKIGDYNLKNIGGLSVKQENSISLENETKLPSTSGVKWELKGKKSIKRCSSGDGWE